MADWTISVARLPIRIGADTNYNHTIIVVKNGSGQKIAEINGGPADNNGTLIPADSALGILAHIAGSFPLGAEIKEAGTDRYYRPGLSETVVYSGSQGQIRTLNPGLLA
jgi:hypothetical protein